MTRSPLLLFYAGRQASRIRNVWIGSLAMLVVSLGAAVAVIALPGAEDGGAAPLAVRVGFGAVLVIFFLAAVVGMTAYARCYVARLELAKDGRTLVVITIGMRGDRRELVRLDDLDERPYTPTELRTVKSAWWTLRVRDRSLPLMLDTQAFAAEPEILAALLTGLPHPALESRSP